MGNFPRIRRKKVKNKMSRSQPRAFVLILVAGVIGGCQSTPDQPMTKDTLIVGNILTQDPNQPTAEALLIHEGTIAAVGRLDDLGKAAGSGARRVVIPPALFVMPGIIESHAHFLGVGRAARQLQLQGTHSAREVALKVAAQAKLQPEGSWIVGRGWNQEDWPDKLFPSRELLDEAAPHHCVVLTRVDGHALWANTLALRKAKVSKGTQSPTGGEILREPGGAPSGILVDNAMALVRSAIPNAAEGSLLEKDLLEAQRQALALGITTFVDAGMGPRVLAVVKKLYAEKRMRLRLSIMHSASTPKDVARIVARDPEIGLFGGRLDARMVKMYADGALGSRGAWLLEDYADRPGHRGFPVTDPKDLEAAAEACLRRGYQLCVHAIGDRANRETLDAFERALRRRDLLGSDHRFRIEHAQIIHPGDLPRFASLGVIPSMQTCHAASDGPWADQRLGRSRLEEEGYSWRMLIASGCLIPNGTDAPVESLSPWINLHAALRRAHPGHPGFTMGQRLRREEALASVTRWGAWATFTEKRRGQLKVGFDADLIVIDRDPRTCPVEQLPELRVLRSYIAGEELAIDSAK